MPGPGTTTSGAIPTAPRAWDGDGFWTSEEPRLSGETGDTFDISLFSVRRANAIFEILAIHAEILPVSTQFFCPFWPSKRTASS